MPTSMRSLGRVAVAVAAAGFLVAAVTPAQADEGTARDFWKAAADAATATVYAPTTKGLRLAGLAPRQSADEAGALTMVCAGEWNVEAAYDARAGGGKASILQATPDCTGDFGAGDAVGTWKFTSAGRTFTIQYEDCLDGRGEGDPTPANSDCAAEDVFYSVDGRLAAAGGKKRTFVHIETTGMSRAQIMTLVRSLTPVR